MTLLEAIEAYVKAAVDDAIASHEQSCHDYSGGYTRQAVDDARAELALALEQRGLEPRP